MLFFGKARAETEHRAHDFFRAKGEVLATNRAVLRPDDVFPAENAFRDGKRAVKLAPSLTGNRNRRDAFNHGLAVYASMPCVVPRPRRAISHDERDDAVPVGANSSLLTVSLGILSTNAAVRSSGILDRGGDANGRAVLRRRLARLPPAREDPCRYTKTGRCFHFRAFSHFFPV